MFRLLFVCTSFLIMTACSARESSPTAGLGLKRRVSTGDGLGELAGLKQACERSGARFREHKRECECESLQFKEEEGKIFSTIDGGSCLSLGRPIPWSHDPSCQGEEPFREAYLSNGIPGLNKCLRGLANFRGTHFGIQVSEDTLAKDALKLARRFDKDGNKIFAKLWPTPENYFFNSTVLYLAGPTKLDRSQVEALIHPPSIQEKGRYRAYFVEPDAASVVESLGHPLDPPRSLASAPESLFAWVRFAEASYAKVLSHNLSGTDIVVGGDCRKHCQVGQIIAEESGLKAVREKRYLYGVPYRDVIRFETTSGEVAGILQLNLRGSFSTMSVVDRILDSDQIQAKVTVFDRWWKRIGEETFTVLENIGEEKHWAERVSLSQGEERGGIVMCEASDLSAMQSRGMLSKLRRLSFSDENWLGWLPNPERSYSRMVSPVVELSDTVLPTFGSREHGLGIAATLLSGPSRDFVTLIPISMPSCLKDFSAWSPVTRDAKVSVVNFSGTYPYEPDWCRAFFPVDEIFSPNAQELWVTAAGNSGAANPVERCPQALGAKDNLIVVSGGNEWGLWKDSDYGVDYADIVAEVGEAGGSPANQGTSYSAPRVAAVAAEIARRFPTMTPQRIRLAILASAKFPSGRPLEVRSGGALNRSLALKLAEKMQSFSSDVSRTTLYLLWTEEFGKEQALERISLWDDRGLFL